jgi:hypothetical protein
MQYMGYTYTPKEQEIAWAVQEAWLFSSSFKKLCGWATPLSGLSSIPYNWIATVAQKAFSWWVYSLTGRYGVYFAPPVPISAYIFIQHMCSSGIRKPYLSGCTTQFSEATILLGPFFLHILEFSILFESVGWINRFWNSNPSRKGSTKKKHAWCFLSIFSFTTRFRSSRELYQLVSLSPKSNCALKLQKGDIVGDVGIWNSRWDTQRKKVRARFLFRTSLHLSSAADDWNSNCSFTFESSSSFLRLQNHHCW